MYPTSLDLLLSVQKFTANLHCICLSEHEPFASADAVHICANMGSAQYTGRNIGDTQWQNVHFTTLYRNRWDGDPAFFPFLPYIMVLILDGSSAMDAHVWCKDIV